MSDDRLRELREVQAYFRLPSVGLVDPAPFTLAYGGGTALARAHRVIRCMSEDVDFKIVPRAAAPVSRSMLRQRLAALRKHVAQAHTGAAQTKITRFAVRNLSLAGADRFSTSSCWRRMPARLRRLNSPARNPPSSFTRSVIPASG